MATRETRAYLSYYESDREGGPWEVYLCRESLSILMQEKECNYSLEPPLTFSRNASYCYWFGPYPWLEVYGD